METFPSLVVQEPGPHSGCWKAVWSAASLLLVATGLLATVLAFEAAPVDSDAAHAWGGLIPVAYVGIAGLRRRRVLLAGAGGLFAIVLTLAGVMLLQMHHLSAGVLIVLGAVGAAEAGWLFVLWRRVTSRIEEKVFQ